MCSFVKLNGKREEVLEVLCDGDISLLFTLGWIMNVKGSDVSSVVVISDGFHKLYTTTTDGTMVTLIRSDVDNLRIGADVSILVFSRQAPETQNSEAPIPQPYFNEVEGTYVAVHGTIPKFKKIAKVNNIKINTDTEIFKYLSFEDAIMETEKVLGKISAISVDIISHESKMYTNGLGIYSGHFIKTGVNIVSNINLNTHNWIESEDIVINDIHHTYLNKDVQNKLGKKVRLISLFSGGLDITLSTLKEIEHNSELKQVSSLDLFYFDWGTVAADAEIKAGINFKNNLNVEYPVTHSVFNVEDMFSNILNVCETQARLKNNDAKGKKNKEAESALSYVPFRNQFLLTLAAAKAEQMYPGDDVRFIIGANLSEGMVYLDNSETFVEHINKTIQVGGQNTYNFSVVAPYVNHTKTSMIKNAIASGFDFSTSFSCYFPKEDVDGKKTIECGKCGSCVLKQEAINRASSEDK
jgi:7-cyano-7-deazaguanine synthase